MKSAPVKIMDEARFYSRSHYALIGIYDEAGYVIDTHEQAGHFGDVAFRAAEANEFSPRHLCDDARKRGLAAAWRSLEIHRWQTICFGCAAQKFARCENVFLADKLIERARPHPVASGAAVFAVSISCAPSNRSCT